jgi:hypothetical protein
VPTTSPGPISIPVPNTPVSVPNTPSNLTSDIELPPLSPKKFYLKTDIDADFGLGAWGLPENNTSPVSPRKQGPRTEVGRSTSDHNRRNSNPAPSTFVRKKSAGISFSNDVDIFFPHGATEKTELNKRRSVNDDRSNLTGQGSMRLINSRKKVGSSNFSNISYRDIETDSEIEKKTIREEVYIPKKRQSQPRLARFAPRAKNSRRSVSLTSSDPTNDPQYSPL